MIEHIYGKTAMAGTEHFDSSSIGSIKVSVDPSTFSDPFLTNSDPFLTHNDPFHVIDVDPSTIDPLQTIGPPLHVIDPYTDDGPWNMQNIDCPHGFIDPNTCDGPWNMQPIHGAEAGAGAAAGAANTSSIIDNISLTPSEIARSCGTGAIVNGTLGAAGGPMGALVGAGEGCSLGMHAAQAAKTTGYMFP